MNMNETTKTTISQDVNRLTLETTQQVFNALYAASKEIQGERTTGEVISESQTYCDMYVLQNMVSNRLLKFDKARMFYDKLKYNALLKELYLRMQTYHHYGACHGRELPGISWSDYESGGFMLHLGDCALNMEHSILDEHTFQQDCLSSETKEHYEYDGHLFAIGYDPDTDCEEDEDGWCDYGKALNFCAEFRDHDGSIKECRDVKIVNVHHHAALLRDLLAQMDVIGDMANEKVSGNGGK